MWRLTMFLLCLIAALSGTPLRQAEAASDFARSHGESDQGRAIETIDGGVGDDSGATILRAGGDNHPPLATMLLAAADAFATPLLPALSLSNMQDRPAQIRWSRSDRLCAAARLAPMLPVLMRVGKTLRCCPSETQIIKEEHFHAQHVLRHAVSVPSR